jgi:hypothetical protein
MKILRLIPRHRGSRLSMRELPFNCFSLWLLHLLRIFARLLRLMLQTKMISYFAFCVEIIDT